MSQLTTNVFHVHRSSSCFLIGQSIMIPASDWLSSPFWHLTYVVHPNTRNKTWRENNAWVGSSGVILFSPALPQIRGIKETNPAYFWHSKTQAHPPIHSSHHMSLVLWLASKHNLLNQNYTKYCTLHTSLQFYFMNWKLFPTSEINDRSE